MRITIISSLLVVLATKASCMNGFSDLLERTTGNVTFDERTGILTLAPDLDPSLARRDWFPATIGMMVERDVDYEPSKMQKRTTSSLRTTRDLYSEEVELGLTKRGEVVWPRAGEEASEFAKRGKESAKKALKRKAKKVKARVTKKAKSVAKKAKQAKSSVRLRIATSIAKFSAVITWYTGHDLLNPYCAQKSGWTPTDQSMIAAVTEQWGKSRPACGSFLNLKTPGSTKSIVVRVVDLCGGCAPGSAHVDLSIAAFKALYALDVG
ncbi:hypothetical protein MNV49_000327 [Pseudohyphozyma bogoriensis]|nr:hypothetical protein MNV49_000327 [Pseudohyphozyma bogoriensis]